MYGFEPVPDMYAAAREQLAEIGCYQLLPMGLGLTPGEAHFALMRDSSRVSSAGEHTVACRMTSVDAFEDLLELPPLIRRFSPDYEFYLSHSSGGFLDTVLYAK